MIAFNATKKVYRSRPSSLLRKAGIVFLFFAIPVALWAHPHVFIEPSIEFLLDGTTIRGIRQEWKFDEVFSGTVINDFDRNRDRKLSAPEISQVRAEAFENLKYYGYFSVVTVDGVVRQNLAVSEFSARIDKGNIIYTFSVDLNLPVGAKNRDIRILVYDDSYYVAFDALQRNKMSVTQSAEFNTNIAISKATRPALYPGQVMPDEVRLTLAPK